MTLLLFSVAFSFRRVPLVGLGGEANTPLFEAARGLLLDRARAEELSL